MHTKFFANSVKMTTKDILKKAEKIKACIISSTTVAQMKSCWTMINNLGIYGQRRHIKAVTEARITLHEFLRKQIHEKWQITLESPD